MSKKGNKPLEVHTSAIGAIERTVPKRQDRVHLDRARLAKIKRTCARAQDSACFVSLQNPCHPSCQCFTFAPWGFWSDYKRSSALRASAAHAIERTHVTDSTLKLSINSPFMFSSKPMFGKCLEAPSMARILPVLHYKHF